ncbi:TniQ family protein [Hydrogenophaga sp. UC242_53]|uniref:TniQ family protein n=1 Tax=Hydrogenophaga sp. UC242_53 TaxID=3350170 RepID=UPI0036D22CF4
MPDESRSSWILRVCGAHGYPMNRFCKYVGLDPFRIDWDFGVDSKRWAALAADSGRCLLCFDRNDHDWWLVKKLHNSPVSPLYVDRKPASRWCSACLVADSTPHLRWYWRISELQRCPYHDTRLSIRCSWCHGFMNLSSAHMLGFGRKRGAANLAGCASCGMPFLVDGVHEPAPPAVLASAGHGLPDPMISLRQVMNRRALSELSTRGEALVASHGSATPTALSALVLNLASSNSLPTWPVYDAGSFAKKQADLIQEFSTPRDYVLLKWWDLFSMRKTLERQLEIERKRVFGTDFRIVFATRHVLPCKPACTTGFWTPVESKKWSAPLAMWTRVRVAKALLMIRKERALQRERACQGLGTEEEQAQINSYAQCYRRY